MRAGRPARAIPERLTYYEYHYQWVAALSSARWVLNAADARHTKAEAFRSRYQRLRTITREDIRFDNRGGDGLRR